MEKVYVVILEDRHLDVGVFVFSNKDKAIDWARIEARKCCHHEADYKETEVTSRMQLDGWVFAADYSCEGDCIRVVEREIEDK